MLLVGGVVSDRALRSKVMLVASAVQPLAIASLASLSLADQLPVWALLLLVSIDGAAAPFCTPAFEAIVPSLVKAEDLPAASAFDQLGDGSPYRWRAPPSADFSS
jgi:ENTS family enterobactin (siderophore) exporter